MRPPLAAFNHEGELVDTQDDSHAILWWYRWHHLPSGQTGESCALFLNQGAYILTIQQWNRDQPETWQYEAL